MSARPPPPRMPAGASFAPASPPPPPPPPIPRAGPPPLSAQIPPALPTTAPPAVPVHLRIHHAPPAGRAAPLSPTSPYSPPPPAPHTRPTSMSDAEEPPPPPALPSPSSHSTVPEPPSPEPPSPVGTPPAEESPEPPRPAFSPMHAAGGAAPQFRMPPLGQFTSVRQAASLAASAAAAASVAPSVAPTPAVPPPLPTTVPSLAAIPPALPASVVSPTQRQTPAVVPPPLPTSEPSVAVLGARLPPPLPRGAPAAVPPPLPTVPPPLPSHAPTPLSPLSASAASSSSTSAAAAVAGAQSAKFSLPQALASVALDTPALESTLQQGEDTLLDTRSRMIDISRQNFILERELLEIDERIKLLIKNRLTVQEVMASSSASGSNAKAAQAGTGEEVGGIQGGAKQKRLYEELFLLLQSKPRYLATLARLIQPKGDSIPLFVQSVCFDIYGDSFGSHEERLLLSLFKTVLRAEMASCTDRATLLRSNSAITQMLSAYAKRGQGLGILREILEQPLKTICESKQFKNLNLELQPLKVHQGLIVDYETESGQISSLDKNVNTDEAASLVPEVQAAIRERVKQLEECCELILVRILQGVESIPYGMRWICKTIGELYAERFGGGGNQSGENGAAGTVGEGDSASDASRPSVSIDPADAASAVSSDGSAAPSTRPSLARQIQSLQGGYIYLRFFNPVIVAPDGMNLIKDKPSRTLRRNLVLVAKVLQNLSNGVLFGGKEAYMQSLNPFIESKREAMTNFFATLCAVDDVDDSLRMDRYTHSSLGSGAITIQLNQIYAMHALLVQFKDKVCVSSRKQPAAGAAGAASPTSPPSAPAGSYNASDPLAILLTKLGHPVPAMVDRANNVSVILRLTDTRSSRLSTIGGGVGGTWGSPADAAAAGGDNTQVNPLYMQAKALLLTTLKRLPPDPSPAQHPSLLSFLTAHKNAAMLSGQTGLHDSLNNLLSMLSTLCSMGLISATPGATAACSALSPVQQREAACNAFLQQLASDAQERHKGLAMMSKQRALVDAALATVQKHHAYLQGRLDVYRTYLINVRQGQAQKAGGGSSSAGASSAASSAPAASSSAGSKDASVFTKIIKYSHADLVGMQLIASMDADIPAKVLKSLQYSLEMRCPPGSSASSVTAPRFFLSVSLKKGVTIPLLSTPFEIVLEELLALQEHSIPTMQVESVALNVNILVHLLNTQFIKLIPKS